MEKRQASSFYPHFNQDERPTIDHIVGLFNNLIFKQQTILTDFFNPGEREILKKIVGNDAFVQEFGGYEDAEKKRVLMSIEWINVNPLDFKIIPLEIDYPTKFAKLTHSSILGTLANSGVELDTFGDIITDGNGKWQFFIKEELLEFFKNEINRIGRTQVKLKEITFKDVVQPEDNSIERTEIVSSLRVDALLASVSKKSRGEIQKVIGEKEVKLNWHDIQNSNIMIKEADILSLRHFGRIRIEGITATRKGKYRVVFRIWQNMKR